MEWLKSVAVGAVDLALMGWDNGRRLLNVKSPFLDPTTNFGPVDREVCVRGEVVEGTLPKELSGEFVRNGPNPAYLPRGLYHWLVNLKKYRKRRGQQFGFLVRQLSGHFAKGHVIPLFLIAGGGQV